MAGNSWQTKLEARKDLESPAADNQLLPTMEVPAVSNHEKQHSKQTSRLIDVDIILEHLRKNGDRKDRTNPSNSGQQPSGSPSVIAKSNNNIVQQGQWYPSKMLHKPLNGVNKNSLSSEFNQPTSFDHQIPEVSLGEKGKLKGVEPCAHLDEEVKEEVEDCDQNVQTTLNPPPPLHRQLEPATSVCAESILVHPSERPLQSEDESSNVQPTITTTIGGSGFPVTYPKFPQFQHNSFIIVIRSGVPTATSALPKLTVFPTGSWLYLSDPRNHVCYTSGYNIPDAPIRIPIHYSGPSISQTTAESNLQPIKQGPGGQLPLHTLGGAINSGLGNEVLAA